MPWYKTGIVSVTLNSNAVNGNGTAFIANCRVGDAFRGPDGRWYEVTNIASDTAMAISPNYQSATAAGSYAIAPMQGYVKDSADALRSLVNQYGAKLAALGTTGNYEILPVDKGGTGSTTLLATMQSQTAAKAAKGANNDITGLLATAYVRVSGTTNVAAGQGLYQLWNTGAGGLSGSGDWVCNQGQGTGGFSWRSVNSTNTATGPTMTYTYAGNLNVPGTVSQGSDRRLKKNDVEITDGLDRIMQIRPVEFDRRDFLYSTEYPHHEVGVIAQELFEITPLLVTPAKPDIEEDIWRVNYTGLIPYLVSAIKTLKAEIEELKSTPQ